MASARHGRQIRLAEVGEAGQARLDAAAVALAGPPSLSREVATTYLVGAGVTVHDTAVAVESPAAAAATLAALGIVDPVAGEVALGALRALVVLRDVLGVAPAVPPAATPDLASRGRPS